MSRSIGDDENKVLSNREKFFNSLGLSNQSVIVQKQIHSDIVNIVDEFKVDLEGDALITRTKNLGLAISTADCNNIYLYDPKENVIAAVHSGWMGTEKRILEKTLQILFNHFNANPNNLFVYFGPSICQDNYEVGAEFKTKFNDKYFSKRGEKFLLDLKSANKDILVNAGVPKSQIEISEICSFENNNFHSYRRDKNKSGRALGVIALRDKVE
jgi:YfiH family protein